MSLLPTMTWLNMSPAPSAHANRSRERVEEPAGGVRDLLDGAVEGGGVCPRRRVEARELAHELQRRGADLVLGRRRLEIEQRTDLAAHRVFLLAPGRGHSFAGLSLADLRALATAQESGVASRGASRSQQSSRRRDRRCFMMRWLGVRSNAGTMLT